MLAQGIKKAPKPTGDGFGAFVRSVYRLSGRQDAVPTEIVMEMLRQLCGITVKDLSAKKRAEYFSSRLVRFHGGNRLQFKLENDINKQAARREPLSIPQIGCIAVINTIANECCKCRITQVPSHTPSMNQL
jgi:hypothetical protein